MSDQENSDSGNIQQPRTTYKAFLRMMLGGVIGAILSMVFTWGYLIIFKKSPVIMHPINVLGSLFIAWIGFVVGAVLSLFSKKWNRS
jgi:threonine/homoserine/homoserine lactone efflux protein